MSTLGQSLDEITEYYNEQRRDARRKAVRILNQHVKKKKRKGKK